MKASRHISQSATEHETNWTKGQPKHSDYRSSPTLTLNRATTQTTKSRRMASCSRKRKKPSLCSWFEKIAPVRLDDSFVCATNPYIPSLQENRNPPCVTVPCSEISPETLFPRLRHIKQMHIHIPYSINIQAIHKIYYICIHIYICHIMTYLHTYTLFFRFV